MTIDEAVVLLAAAAARHGGSTPLYFDCPHCGASFPPTRLVTEAVHLQPDPQAPAKEPR